MGRHYKQTVTLRKVAAVAVGGLGLAAALSGTASADPVLGNCGDTQRGTNPDVRVCSDHGYGDGYGTGSASDRRSEDRGSDRLHAIVKADPLLCVHVIVDPQGNRRLVSTRGCDTHHQTPVTAQPCPPCPPGTVPPAGSTCPTPAPVTPATPVAPAPSSPVEGGSTGPASDVSSETPPAEAQPSAPVEAHLPVTH